MQSDTLLHVANFSTLFICMVLKFPQIFVLMRAKTTTGVSLNSLLLELIGFVILFVGGKENQDLCCFVFFTVWLGCTLPGFDYSNSICFGDKQLKLNSDLMLLDLLKMNVCPSSMGGAL